MIRSSLRPRAIRLAAALAVALLAAGCSTAARRPDAPQSSCGTPVRFAVIGDYGSAGPNEAAVAALVKGWAPDFVITVGDNNYPLGSSATIDPNIGQYYAAFMAPYSGAYGPGAAENAFFPALGNHDWYDPSPTGGTDADPYLSYFVLPGNERYYDFVRGEVHLFVLDSDDHEPDGITSTSVQGEWLRAGLAASTSRWNVVYFHHAPYSSGATHGSTLVMRWPFEAWGASAVLAGHEHLYERLQVGGIPYFVNGLGGDSIYTFGTPLPESRARWANGYGAQLVEADGAALTFEFHDASGALVDAYRVEAATPCGP